MKKGFTLIELLAVVVILAIILVITVPIIGSLIDDVKKSALEKSGAGLIKAAEYLYAKDIIDGDTKKVTFNIGGGTITSVPAGINLEFDGKVPDSGMIVLEADGTVKMAVYQDNLCAEKTSGELTLTEKTVDECTLLVDGEFFLLSEDVNRPELKTGMIAVKHDNTNWVTVSDPVNDKSWYDYNGKQWANMVLVTTATRATYQNAANGTIVNPNDIIGYFVWIPRYAYQIASNYHTNTKGTINVKFLRDKTNLTKNNQTVDLTPTYNAGNQTNFIKHPAFTLNGVELTGLWVAKFEASVSNTAHACYTSSSVANCNNTSLTPAFKPNVNSWRNLNVGNAYYVSENMKNNAMYGLVNTEVHTHLMKNVEWGVVSYLTDSVYGRNAAVWNNNSSTFITGCAGATTNAAPVAGCVNQYQTATGFNASTTGNITGVYDLSGGAWEHVSSYVDNANSVISTNGVYVMLAANAYKELYPKAATDNSTNNYAISNSIIGDAMYETSSSGTDNGYTWYGNWSTFPSTNEPFIIRGSSSGISGSGIYHFYRWNGSSTPNVGFRTIIVNN